VEIMWDGIVTRIVQRAMPPDIGDSSQEFLAGTAAENAVRLTARLAALVVLVLLLAIGWLVYRGVGAGAPGTPGDQAAGEPARGAARVAEELGAENARLSQRLADLQRQLDELASQRNSLQARLEAGPPPRPAPPGPASTAKRAPVRPAPRAARSAESPGGGAGREALPPPAPALEPGRSAAPSRPAEGYRCGDGRTVADPAECKPAAAPARVAGEAPRAGVQCGDGRSVTDPAACEPRPQDDLRPARSLP